MKNKLLFASLAALLIAGCQHPGARIHQDPVVGAVTDTLEDPDGLDRPTTALLRREKLLSTFRRDSAAAVRILHQRWQEDPSETRRTGLVSVCAAAAGRAGEEEAPGFHLAAAEFAWPLAIADQTTDERRRCRAIHTNSCGELAEQLFDEFREGRRRAEFAGPLRSYRVDVTTPGINPAEPDRFDQMIRANRIELRKLDMPRHRVEGIGADLVFFRANTPKRYLVNPLLHQGGLAMPTNACLVFGGNTKDVELRLHDLMLSRTTPVGGRNLTLSADFSAPFAILVEHSDFSHPLSGLLAMFRTTEYDDLTGLYQIEPWRKNQIPVVFVHGLASSPMTWLKIMNEFSADPVLQKRYQFLGFRYPTGYPIARNAASLRRHLREMRQSVDPADNSPTMDKMVLVGHSMGGILSNMQLRSSGEKMRELAFDRPLAELDLSEEQRRNISDLAYFEPDPNVRRAVFIASPHRGSDLASNRLGRFGSWLIRLPLDLLTYGLTGQTLQGTTAFGSQLLTEGNDSIKTLKPDNPALTTALELPLGPGVRYHSIIGNHKMTEPLEESTDGVVAYWSSHLGDAASEEVVDATHMNILRDDAAIEELRRLLYMHAGLKYER